MLSVPDVRNGGTVRSRGACSQFSGSRSRCEPALRASSLRRSACCVPGDDNCRPRAWTRPTVSSSARAMPRAAEIRWQGKATRIRVQFQRCSVQPFDAAWRYGRPPQRVRSEVRYIDRYFRAAKISERALRKREMGEARRFTGVSGLPFSRRRWLRIRDEIRMIRPGFYIGGVYANRLFLPNSRSTTLKHQKAGLRHSITARIQRQPPLGAPTRKRRSGG